MSVVTGRLIGCWQLPEKRPLWVSHFVEQGSQARDRLFVPCSSPCYSPVPRRAGRALAPVSGAAMTNGLWLDVVFTSCSTPAATPVAERCQEAMAQAGGAGSRAMAKGGRGRKRCSPSWIIGR